MAKLKLHHGLASGEIDKAADDNQFSTYMGPAIADAPGVYRGVVKGITYKKSSAGHPMFMFVFEVKEEKGSDRFAYNGAAIFHNVMLPIDREDKNFGRQAANIKEILQAIDPKGVAWKGYIADDFTVTSDDTPKVTVIGKYKHNAIAGSPVKALVRKGKEYADPKTGQPKPGSAEIRSINALLEGDAASGPVKSGPKVVVEEDDDEDTGVEFEPTEDGFEEDETEETPEPVKKAPVKRAAKKKAPEPEPEEEEEEEEDQDEEELSVVELPDEEEDEEDEPEEEEEAPAPKKRVVKKAVKKVVEPEPEDEEDEEAEEEDDDVDEEPEAEPEPPKRRRRASTFADED